MRENKINRVNSASPKTSTNGRQAPKPTLLPLEVKAITYKPAGLTIIDSLTFKLTQPGLTVIMGPNGAGKTVLLRLLHGMLLPTSGNITWADQPLGQALRRRQAMVFQTPVLLRRSAAANIDFVLGLRSSDASMPAPNIRRDKLLNRVRLLDRANYPARALSGGEQQRLSLARALALTPDVLFLDEPTASLDPASAQLIEDIVLDEHNRGTKIIFVTHDIGQARRLADNILFLHHGRLLEQASAVNFFTAPTSTAARQYLSGQIVI